MSNSEIEIKPIEGYEGIYSVTSDGQVISEERTFKAVRNGTLTEIPVRTKVLKPSKTDDGYSRVKLYKNGVSKTASVHRLVALAYLPPPLPGQTEVRHKKGDPSKNTKDDLEWGTMTENQRDRVRHGTSNTGQKNGKATSSDEEIRQIKLRLKAGETQASLAKEFGTSYIKMYQIANGKTWAHVSC